MLYLNDGTTIEYDQYPENKSLTLLVKHANLTKSKPIYLDSIENYWEICNEVDNQNVYNTELVEYCYNAVADLQTYPDCEPIIELLEAVVKDARSLTGEQSPCFEHILHALINDVIARANK